MADNVTLPGVDSVVATDDITGVQYQKVKLVDGTADSTTVVAIGGGVEASALRVTVASDSTGVLSIDDNGGIITVDGTVTANLSATDNAVLDTIDTALDAINAKLVTGTVIGDVNLGATDNAVLDTIAAKDFATQTTLAALNAKMVTGTDIGDVTINNSTGAAAVNIQDGGNTITVDGAVTNTVLSVVGSGTEATAQRVTIASDSTGVLSIDDNGGALTVDGTVTANLSATDNAVLDAIEADTTIIAGAVSATHMQVDVLTAPSTAVTGTFWQATQPVSGTVSVNSHAVTNAGTFVTQENGSALTSLQLLDDTVFADDSAFTVATSKVTSIGLLADETSTDSVDEGDIGLPRMTLDRKQIAVLSPHATGESLDTFFSIDLDETEEDIKGTAGKIYGYYIYNSTAATLYVRFYNSTSAGVTVGTTAAILVIPIPAGAAANCSFPQGIGFSTALCAAATTGVAANDTGAPAANALVINVFYK